MDPGQRVLGRSRKCQDCEHGELGATLKKGTRRCLKKGTGLLGSWRWFLFFVPVIGQVCFTLRAIGLSSAITLIWLNKGTILKSGGEGADRLKELLRTAVPWYLLLLGSSFLLAGALIQFALAWPWQGSGPQ